MIQFAEKAFSKAAFAVEPLAEVGLQLSVGPGGGCWDERRRLVEDIFQEDVSGEAIANLSPTEMARANSSLFATFCLVDLIDRVREPRIPDLRNTEGDEVVLCVARFPLAAGTTSKSIRSALQAHDEFCMTDTTSWNWITRERRATAAAGERPGQALNLETWRDDGSLVLGDVRLEDKAVVLSVNSRQRCERGNALLSAVLGSLVGKPSIETETVEQMMASHNAAEPQEVDISEAEKCAIIHDQMDRHYRSVLDEPVPALGGLTPRAAVKTDDGRIKVVEWLKMMENETAKSGARNSAMASYNFGWLWTELGLAGLRR